MTVTRVLAVLLCASLGDAARAGPRPLFNRDIESYCMEYVCRQHVPFRLRTEREPVTGNIEVYWPAVQGAQISILVGETLYIEADVKRGKLVNLRHVPTVSAPERTLTLTFTQNDDDLGMLLTVRNPFDVPLKYHANMVDFGHRLHHTSSCPVVARGLAYEMWPHPIPELIISDLRLLKPTGGTACVY